MTMEVYLYNKFRIKLKSIDKRSQDFPKLIQSVGGKYLVQVKVLFWWVTLKEYLDYYGCGRNRGKKAAEELYQMFINKDY